MRKGSIPKTRDVKGPAGGVDDAALGAPEDSSPRARVPDLVPAGWLDRLLAAAVDLPLSAGERAVIEAMVDSLAAILPAYSVAACLVDGAAGGAGEPLVVRRFADGVADLRGRAHPTRLFPDLAHEYAAAIRGGAPGSTIHVAADHDELDRAGSPAV